MKIPHKIWHKIGLLAVLAALTALLCSCNAKDVRLPEQVDLFAGQQFALASAVEIEGDPDAGEVLAAAAMADRYGITVTFASSDPAVVTVDAAGVLQAAAPGQATVTVDCDALGYTAQVRVTVQQPAAGLSVVPALQLATGETASLQPSVQNADAADLVYQVSDPAVVKVDAGGNVTALSQGRTYITALLPGSTLTAGCVVTVGTPAESIQLSRPEAELAPGEMLTLAAVTAPQTDTALTWQSDNPAVATVENGVVTAQAAGSAVITASADGQQAACRITVTADAVSATAESATPESATAESATPESATPESAATSESATPESAATPETAMTPESASTPESATPESTATAEGATSESAATLESAATPESATPETAATPENATAESAATAETATPESATSERAATAESATPESAATSETAMTPESAATPESATPETATSESATAETASPEPAAPDAAAQPPAKSWLSWLADAWVRLTGG